MKKELKNGYLKIKFLKLEVVQANAKAERLLPKSLMKYCPIKNRLGIRVVQDSPKKGVLAVKPLKK